MLSKNKRSRFFRRICKGALLILTIVTAVAGVKKDTIVGQLFSYETMPNYRAFANMDIPKEVAEDYAVLDDETEVFVTETEIDAAEEKNSDIIGLSNVVFQPETTSGQISENHFMKEIINLNNLTQMRSIDYLKKNIYIVQDGTDMTEKDFDVSYFASADLTLKSGTSEPQVLIFNTHSNEMFSNSKDKSEGVEALCLRLCQLLNEKYGIRAVYTKGDFDVVDGKSQVLGAYERMEPVISKLLKDNPSIEVAIDIHRDGIDGDRKLVTTVNGKPTAQLMFVDGLCKTNESGKLQDIASLPNPNLKDNLAFSFQMQMAAASLYPDNSVTRKIYLKPYRYSLHMLPKSLLVEVGAQTNTKEEALNAIEPLAEMLDAVLKGK